MLNLWEFYYFQTRVMKVLGNQIRILASLDPGEGQGHQL